MLAASRREAPALVRIAIPLVLAQMAQNGMGLVDTLMTGRLGPGALAGIAIGAMALLTLSLSVGAVLFAVTPLTAQAMGAAREEEAARVARHGIAIAFVLAVPVMAALWFLGPLLPLLGQDPTTAAAATGYLRAVVWGIPAYMIFVALRGTLEGRGHSRPIMAVAFFGVALNVVANNAFMFGRWGFPALGLTGVGVATSIVYTAMAVALAAIVASSYRAHRVFRVERLRRAHLAEIVRLGVPIALTVAFEVGLFSTTALLVGLFGQAPLAGHQIAIQTASFAFMVPLGIGIATTARVGQAAGRADAAGVRAAGAVGMGLAVCVMILSATLFATAPRWVVGLYLDPADPANADVVRNAIALLRVAALFQLVDGLQVSALGALRGLRDTRVPMLITLLSYWFVGIGSAVLLAFVVGLGPVGLWLGLVAGLAVAAAWLLFRFRSLVGAMPDAHGPGAAIDSGRRTT